MQRSRSTSTSPASENIFSGVRFVLFGFDSVSEAQYRSELVRRGGIEVSRYDERCTHVIVSGRVYDDPVCIAAREDTKMLVNELWIDDSLELGMLADATRILYRPVKDINGIPGSKSLHICLTGYQRQERDYVMKMVSLMGAKFSKPLIANQVTHLICYKFEGEKYELAKKVNIKLVNHQWLEDCLKAWQVLPIDGYQKSGWELEILETAARDSEEEAEDVGTKVSRRSSVGTSTIGGGNSSIVNFHMPVTSTEKTSAQKDTFAARNSATSDFGIMSSALFATPSKEISSSKLLDECNLGSRIFHESHPQDAGGFAQMGNIISKADAMSADERRRPSDSNLKKGGDKFSSELASTSSAIDEKQSKLSCLRKTQRKPSSPEEPSVNLCASPAVISEIRDSKLDFNGLSSNPVEGRAHGELGNIQSPTSTSVYCVEQRSNALPQKRKASLSGASLKSPKSDCQNMGLSSRQSPSPSPNAAQLEATALLPPRKNDLVLAEANSPLEYAAFSNSIANQLTDSLKSKSLSYKRSLKHGKPVLVSKQPNAVVSLSKKPGTPPVKQGSDEQKDATDNWSSLEPTYTTVDNKVLPDLPIDNKLVQGDGVHQIMRSTTNQFCSLVMNSNLTDATSFGEMKSDILPNRLEKDDLGTGPKNSKAAGCNMHDIAIKESAQACNRQLREGDVSLDSNDAVTRKSLTSATADTFHRNNAKAISGPHVKKAVSKRSMNGKKLSALHGMKNEQILDADRTVTPDKYAVESGQLGESRAETEFEKSKGNMMNGQVKPFPDDVVMDDRPEVAGHPNPANIDNDVNMDLMNTSLDDDKENVPDDRRLYSNCNNDRACDMVLKYDEHLFQKSNSKNVELTKTEVPKSEPAWFVLSGHRLQRKEFQRMIKRLRGRVCKDSHQWSYQATHFVVPDPVRRTEKFFAAAAAGRWILKTDYLTASNEAGKFLDEEPYEWYRKGLTEDGALNLEAPRKWRLLRERTGHGALYGMRILVYGECIAPTLDTLKRVVKAGDGTILATSPPYSRFIKSGVDYAVVSPSMPRVDCWIQEFLRHEVPCVSADYLVEYVCKPGYSLERHVLYNTQAWAAKSFTKLLTLSEEITKDTTMVSEERSDDLSCAICGSRERGEVMLICGNEAGTVGCGIGTHIDCCDPPLEGVPEGDWFCPKCIHVSSKTSFRSTKTKSSSRRK